jgi:hypothetical protein
MPAFFFDGRGADGDFAALDGGDKFGLAMFKDGAGALYAAATDV